MVDIPYCSAGELHLSSTVQGLHHQRAELHCIHHLVVGTSTAGPCWSDLVAGGHTYWLEADLACWQEVDLTYLMLGVDHSSLEVGFDPCLLVVHPEVVKIIIGKLVSLSLVSSYHN